MRLLFLFLLLIYIPLMVYLSAYVYSLFQRKALVSVNFQGKVIIQSFGVLFLLHYASFLLLLLLFDFSEWLSRPVYLLFLIILIISSIGWIDDYYGTTTVRGIKGHLQVFLRERKMTTGLLKAGVGFILAAFVAYFFSDTLFQWLLQTFLFCFSIHFFNLLDVRPGRVIKSFWFFILLVLPFFTWTNMVIYMYPLLISSIILFSYDRRCLTMLGDTGSNVLGAICGFYLLVTEHSFLQFFFLIFFLSLSMLAEKYSFTAYVNKTPWLAKLDKWGII